MVVVEGFVAFVGIYNAIRLVLTHLSISTADTTETLLAVIAVGMLLAFLYNQEVGIDAFLGMSFISIFLCTNAVQFAKKIESSHGVILPLIVLVIILLIILWLADLLSLFRWRWIKKILYLFSGTLGYFTILFLGKIWNVLLLSMDRAPIDWNNPANTMPLTGALYIFTIWTLAPSISSKFAMMAILSYVWEEFHFPCIIDFVEITTLPFYFQCGIMAFMATLGVFFLYLGKDLY